MTKAAENFWEMSAQRKFLVSQILEIHKAVSDNFPFSLHDRKLLGKWEFLESLLAHLDEL